MEMANMHCSLRVDQQINNLGSGSLPGEQQDSAEALPIPPIDVPNMIVSPSAPLEFAVALLAPALKILSLSKTSKKHLHQQ